MIKWFGTHVYSLISRFRNQVYLEEVASSSDTQVLVRNASTGLVTHNSSAGGGDTIVAGEGIDISGTGNVTVRGEDATVLNKGIASFNALNFSVVDGAVSAYQFHLHAVSYSSTSNGNVWLPNNNNTGELSTAAYTSRILMPYAGSVIQVGSRTSVTTARAVQVKMYKGTSDTDPAPLSSQQGTTLSRSSGQDQVGGSFINNTTDWTFNRGDLIYFERRDQVSGGPGHVNMTITFKYTLE